MKMTVRGTHLPVITYSQHPVDTLPPITFTPQVTHLRAINVERVCDLSVNAVRMSFTARAAKPARDSSDKESEEERREEKERAEPSSTGTHPLLAATAPVTCRTVGL